MSDREIEAGVELFAHEYHLRTGKQPGSILKGSAKAPAAIYGQSQNITTAMAPHRTKHSARSIRPRRVRHGRLAFGSLAVSGRSSHRRTLRPVTSSGPYRGVLEPALQRPLTIRNFVTVLSTQSDLVEYVKETRTDNAAPVTEATQLLHSGDVTATKPESGIAFDILTAPVRQFAHWIPATRRILSDANQLAQYIEAALRDGLGLELEDQMLTGTGGAGFTGIYNATGTQTAGPPAGGLTEIDLLLRAVRLIRVNARTSPTAIVVHPDDAERWATTKTAQGEYLLSDPGSASGPESLWTLPIVESDAAQSGIALVGDFRKAVLFERDDPTISVGTVGDDFIRNIVRVLGESRAAFAVTRPNAFVEVDIVA